MSSFYDDASLVVIPSGYKTSKVYAEKPTDGSGDLAFTRTGDTATRVNSAGLIEKVRTNLILQSNTFSTTWANTNSTDTGGQTGYDGTSNAWLLESTTASGEAYLRQLISASSSNTFSIYAKAGTSNFLAVYINATSGTDPFAYFNLSTGAVGTTSATATASIVSVGSGWYRCSIAYNATISNVDVYVTSADGSFLSTTGENILIQDSQLEAGDIATEPILTTSAAVSVGPVANVPRLDYLNSSCPRLLLEPQRTNLVTYSEQFNNADWFKAETTITANAIVSPDGYTNADKIESTLTIGCYVNQSTTNTGVYTHSVYAKAGNVSSFTILRASYNSGKAATFNLSNGTVTTVGATVSATITSVGNGWYRCTTTDTSANYIVLFSLNNPTNTPISVGSYIYLWGAQAEAGAYATSYIPTLGAAVTRGADAASKTGISSLIGQTEGTIFYDGYFGREANEVYLFLQKESSSTVDDSIYIQKDEGGSAINLNVWVGATQQSIFGGGTFTVGQRIKVAAAYKANDFVMYINGTQIGTDNAGSVPTCGALQLASYRGLPTNAEYIAEEGVNQALLFKTRLTNAALAELTTL